MVVSNLADSGGRRRCVPTVAVGVGGVGRVLVSGFLRATRSLFQSPSPYHMGVEFDLTDHVGRGHIEDPYETQLEDRYFRHRVAPFSPRAVVAERGEDAHCPYWETVYQPAVAECEDIATAGGHQNPQIAALAWQFGADPLEQFCQMVAQRARAMYEETHVGWERQPYMYVLSFGSPCGSVGAAAQPVLDRLLPPLVEIMQSQSVAVTAINIPALIADEGQVPDRVRAQAVQQAYLREILFRATGG